MTPQSEVGLQLARACRRLLSALDRDPYSPTFGCFDRRYWAWKIADAPELTFQRNALTIAWHLARGAAHGIPRAILADGAAAALTFAAARQHRDGSFDQAFPGEHSYGATAFLLHDAVHAVALLREAGAPVPAAAEPMLRNAARFLIGTRERHAFIANHLAGAAAALSACGGLFGDAHLSRHANALRDQVLESQHREGWFPEYGGADPGYQSLCLYYLTQTGGAGTHDALRTALARGADFLSWFAHPDGSFGGEYGSRRTAVLYPGGLAKLAGGSASAAALARFAMDGLARGSLTGLDHLDDGNLAPMAMNCIAALESEIPPDGSLPFETRGVTADFHAAGLFVRSAGDVYAVIGASNGGVIKAFNRATRLAAADDTGYAASSRGRALSSQSRHGTTWQAGADAIVIDAGFAPLPSLTATPWRFIALRLLGLTALRVEAVREWVKRQVVARLMTPAAVDGPRLRRTIAIAADRLMVDDVITGAAHLEWIESGRSFVSIHMASARYFPGFAGAAPSPARHTSGGRAEWRRSFTIG